MTICSPIRHEFKFWSEYSRGRRHALFPVTETKSVLFCFIEIESVQTKLIKGFLEKIQNWQTKSCKLTVGKFYTDERVNCKNVSCIFLAAK